MKRCKITYVAQCEAAPFERAKAQKVVDLALAEAGRSRCSLTVMLVSAKESDALHRRHFAVPDATDVMTFPDGADDPETGLTHLGDLAVCPKVADSVARARGRTYSDEIVLYILHGVLHLLDYDDTTPAERARIWSAQRRLLQQVGIELEATPE